MNQTPAGNKRWHQSFNQISLCRKCHKAFWHIGSICPDCHTNLKVINHSILGLRGKIISYTYYQQNLTGKDKIIHYHQIIALAKLDLTYKKHRYRLFLNLPLVAEVQPDEVDFSLSVEVVLRRGRHLADQPLIYLPKLKLLSSLKTKLTQGLSYDS